MIAATGDDKANVVLSLLAKTEFAVSRVVARVNDPRNEWLFDSAWGVDVAVSTPRMLASLVRRRSRSEIWCDSCSSGRAMPTWSRSPCPTTPRGRSPGAQAGASRDAALVTILRGQRVIVPEPDEPLEGGDELLFVAAPEVEEELRAALLAARSG